MEGGGSSEMLASTAPTARRHGPQDYRSASQHHQVRSRSADGELLGPQVPK